MADQLCYTFNQRVYQQGYYQAAANDGHLVIDFGYDAQKIIITVDQNEEECSRGPDHEKVEPYFVEQIGQHRFHQIIMDNKYLLTGSSCLSFGAFVAFKAEITSREHSETDPEI